MGAPQAVELRNYYPELDGLRGFAVLVVMLYHFGFPWADGGYLGVDLFFVLSGFVVTRALSRDIEQEHWQRRFLRRRFWRLMPAMAVLLLAAALWFGRSQGGIDRQEWAALLGGLSMTYNWTQQLASADRGIVHLWSLAVEWQFYLLVPLLMSIGRPRLMGWLLAIAMLSVLARGVFLSAGINPLTVYMATGTRLDGLLIGMVIALAPVRALLLIPSWAGICGMALAACLVFVLPRWYDGGPLELLTGPIFAVVACSLVIASTAARSQVPATLAWLATPAMRWLGERSYSIYLWHYFLGVTVLTSGDEEFQGWLLFALQFAISLIAGALSFRWVERPLRHGWMRGATRS